MKLATLAMADARHVGIVVDADTAVLDLAAAAEALNGNLPTSLASMQNLIEAGPPDCRRLSTL